MRSSKNKAVYGLFANRTQVERSIESLRIAGFRREDVSVLMSDGIDNMDFAHEKATKAPEGATTGAASGLILGGALGWLVSIGSLAIPGLGPFIAAGPIMAALAGAGVGSAVGGLTGALIGAGLPEYEAKRFEGLVKDGGILMSIHCDSSDWVQKAKDILTTEGASGVAAAGEGSKVVSGTKTDRPTAPPPRGIDVTITVDHPY